MNAYVILPKKNSLRGPGSLNLQICPQAQDLNFFLATTRFPPPYYQRIPTSLMMSNPEASFIFTLPNETLLHICSFLSPYDRVRFRADDGVEHNLPQILILRSISRRFRETSYRLSFWYQDDADFSSLVPSTSSKYKRLFCEHHFFMALYSDKNLANCLSKKTGWVFSSIEHLLYVIRAVPFFHSSIRRLTLKPPEQKDIWVAIRILALINRITELSLQVGPLESELDEVSFDLSCVAPSFPLVQSLTISGLEQHEGVLHDRHLRRLMIHACYTGGDFSASLLPLNSAQSLTSFCIVNVTEPFVGPNQSLDLFTNLTDFEAVPLSDEVCLALTESKITLRRFGARIFTQDPTEEDIAVMFSSHCFRNLQDLTINCAIHGTVTPDLYLESATIVIQAITCHLQSVHTLAFDMGMDISWCALFISMKNLRSLRWAIQNDDRGKILFRHGQQGNNQEDALKKVIQEFERNFEEKPSLLFDFNPWYSEKFYGPKETVDERL